LCFDASARALSSSQCNGHSKDGSTDLRDKYLVIEQDRVGKDAIGKGLGRDLGDGMARLEVLHDTEDKKTVFCQMKS
jgi:hypothetical protein